MPPRLLRLLILLLGMLSLVAGVLSGLARLGIGTAAPLAGIHGALMMAFFGTVISLERAVALGYRWAYAAPLCAGASGLTLLLGGPLAAAQILLMLGACGLVAASAVVLARQPRLFNVTLGLGALCWLIGATGWGVTQSIPPASTAWLSFLVLTIAGERLELTRFLPTPRMARHLFIAIVATIFVGALATLGGYESAAKLWAAGLLAQALWLMRYDIARKTVKQAGLTRFIAVALLSGYAWLALGAAFGLLGAIEPGHPLRDAALHSLALGFVFSMVFGHAPIILPAMAKLKIAYHPAFYLPLALLHLSLLLRVGADLAGIAALLRGAAIANALALLLFILTMLAAALCARQARA